MAEKKAGEQGQVIGGTRAGGAELVCLGRTEDPGRGQEGVGRNMAMGRSLK